MYEEYVKKVEKIANIYADKVLEHIENVNASDLEKITIEIKILYELTLVQIRVKELSGN